MPCGNSDRCASADTRFIHEYEKSANIRWGLDKSVQNPELKIFSRICYSYPYHTMKAMGVCGHNHYFEGVLEALFDDADGFSIQGFEEYYSKQEIEMLEAIQRKLRGQ